MKFLLAAVLSVVTPVAFAVAAMATVATGVDCSPLPLALDRAGTWACGKKLGGDA